ncbi:MAG: acetoin utilization protein AcuC [Chloroflexota bacterium]|nr:acetoin utilization protein AcuC [Chloroflexota bacterium]
MARKTAFVYADELSRHILSETHPMKPARLRYTYELLQAYNAFDAPNVSVVAPREALLEEIQWYHSADYVDAVQRLNNGDVSVDQRKFNFGPGDNPAYRGIYDASALSTGATMTAVEMLLSDEVDAAFSISGGLHHAMPSYAYGFCVFNDPVIGIKRLLAEGLRVAYVDIDCHHGDGVQHAFYDTDAVMTISLHESGAFLFPGTGHTQEIGAGRGRGYSVNMPLYPYTTDEVYLWALREVAMPLLHRFQPDVLVTQLGIDSHFRDPITHLALSVQGHAAAVQELASLGARKWLALGGGGYDLQAVARAWAMDFAVMSEQNLPAGIPQDYAAQYGVSTLRDVEELPLQADLIRDARTFAEAGVQSVQRLVFGALGLR